MLDKKQVLTLLQIPGIGRRTVHKILRDTTSSVGPSGQSELLRHLKSSLPERIKNRSFHESDLEHASDEAEKIMERTQELGIEILSWGDDLLPSRLWTIPDPPMLLYLKGDPTCLTSDSVVTVVGTRHPTDRGLTSAGQLGSAFAKLGFTVVSGLALGCDTAAHKGCLSAGGRTAAVLAHGLDDVYPPTNRELVARILDKGGCVLSEYPPHTKPGESLFVERDRLQSGLGMAVVVVETSRRGGTIHTVDYARKQRRKIACLLPPPDLLSDSRYSGNLEMINSGIATALEQTDPSLVEFAESLRKTSMKFSFHLRRSKKSSQQEIARWL